MNIELSVNLDEEAFNKQINLTAQAYVKSFLESYNTKIMFDSEIKKHVRDKLSEEIKKYINDETMIRQIVYKKMEDRIKNQLTVLLNKLREQC